MNILFAFPSRSRPERLKRQMAELEKHLAQPDKCSVNFVIDDDDSRRADYLRVIDGVKIPHTVTGGKSENKIHAVNRAVSEAQYQWDIVVVMSDDMRIVLPKFDDEIRSQFAADTDLLLHYNDGYANHKLITFAIMGRDYYNRFKYVYNPAYISLWCDNEQMDVADWLGRRKYIPKQIVSHEHPANRHNTNDQQYRHTEKFFNTDKQTYLAQKANNFGLPLLTVCICTIDGREKQFDRIRKKVLCQIPNAKINNDGEVELLSLKDNKEISVGEKRNRLVNKARGKFVVFIDDDDDIPDYYIASIINVIKNYPDADCIGFLQQCTFDGSKPVAVKLSLQYSEWGDKVDGFAHVRTPYHKTPILLSKVVKAGGFKDMRYGEDHDFSKRVYPLLYNEVFINAVMYYYQYKTENHNTKYGIK
jgi:glycosyltransferase involved in cell wall biosynthesis